MCRSRGELQTHIYLQDLASIQPVYRRRRRRAVYRRRRRRREVRQPASREQASQDLAVIQFISSFAFFTRSARAPRPRAAGSAALRSPLRRPPSLRGPRGRMPVDIPILKPLFSRKGVCVVSFLFLFSFCS